MSNNNQTKASDVQAERIREVQKNYSSGPCEKIIYPPKHYAGGMPDIKTFYQKTIIVIDPKNQFPAFFSNIKCWDCNSSYTNDGWCGNNSYVHGVDGGEYLVQRR
jgi:hypothetical protein